MKDILTKGTAEGVRIYALCTTNLVQEAAIRHHTSHLASAALGRAMNGALLLAATMKDNEAHCPAFKRVTGRSAKSLPMQKARMCVVM